MTCEVELFDRENGFYGVYRYEAESITPLGAEYMWSEGNYACDCNRYLCLYGWEAKPSWQCNHLENRIAALSVKVNDIVVYSEIPLWIKGA